ncbi:MULTISPECIES: methyltransferase domain-containing protein [Prochlorococcus]|uniref:methyltransferase domain-containing protein n=1 Tax=Prochlorococcus TaxID=1218 RepID=UPI000533AAC9|nr:MULTISPECIES: methyltransferase domain-containing protein [Prochlorococcus]KGG13533.1 2-methyl-6-phytyl-1,4-benzoquinone methyltransferase [Prochlorococcus sp. MIT 0601]
MFSLILLLLIILLIFLLWNKTNRKYKSKESVSKAYDSWTNDQLLEKLWGDHIHLGYYNQKPHQTSFQQAKVEFVHQLVRWSGLDQLPKGSRILDVGCGIGGSSRILARDYNFDVLGITISNAQVQRARQLTPNDLMCSFQVMDALNLDFSNGSFDGIWSVEAGPHMPDKQLYADEMLRVLRPGGILAVADWNRREESSNSFAFMEKMVLEQLLHQWSHPHFSSIEGFKENLSNSSFSAGLVEVEDWTKFTIPSWKDSILEGIRRPKVFFDLGPKSLYQGLREVPTILLMQWAFSTGLMRFGVFRTRG